VAQLEAIGVSDDPVADQAALTTVIVAHDRAGAPVDGFLAIPPAVRGSVRHCGRGIPGERDAGCGGAIVRFTGLAVELEARRRDPDGAGVDRLV